LSAAIELLFFLLLFALDSKGVGDRRSYLRGAVAHPHSNGARDRRRDDVPPDPSDASTAPTVPSAVYMQFQPMPPHDFAPKAELLNASPDYAPRAELVSLPVRRATLVKLRGNTF